METFLHQFLSVWQPMSAVCVFMAVIPTPAICESVDQVIIMGDADLRAFDMFYVNENFTIEMKVELDMLMPLAQFKELFGPVGSTRSKRAGIEGHRWPNATVPYELFPGDILDHATEIRGSLKYIEQYTCMRFVETSTAKYRLQFVSSDDLCASYIGFNRLAIQKLWLSWFCAKSKQTIVHEVFHAIGFAHEHTRPDRDSYVSVPHDKLGNVNFMKQHSEDYGVPYDYLSISHYSSRVLTALNPDYQHRIGSTSELSYGDIKQINLRYDCATLRARCPAKTCPFSGFVLFKAFKGQPACQCFCDSGNQYDPIVPCSSITEEVPGPNTATSSLADPDPNQCFNLRSDCDSLKIKGMCEKEPGRMFEQCTKTCGFCERAKDLCFDRDPGCEMMEESCTDSVLQGLMSQRCRKTCKLCKQSSSACELQQSMRDSRPSSALGQAKPMYILLVVQLTCFYLVAKTNI